MGWDQTKWPERLFPTAASLFFILLNIFLNLVYSQISTKILYSKGD